MPCSFVDTDETFGAAEAALGGIALAGDTCGRLRGFVKPYQIFTRSSGLMYSLSPSFTLNAAYQLSMLRSGMEPRAASGACGLVSTRFRSASSRCIPRHTWA